MRLSDEIIAVHLTRLEGDDAKEHGTRLRRRWRRDVEESAQAAGMPAPRLVELPSPFRSITAPLLKFLLQLKRERPGCAVAVVIPALIEAHWWDRLMHTRRVRRVRSTLLRHGGDIAVMTVPWALDEPPPEAVIKAEEPEPAPRPAASASV